MSMGMDKGYFGRGGTPGPWRHKEGCARGAPTIFRIGPENYVSTAFYRFEFSTCQGVMKRWCGTTVTDEITAYKRKSIEN